jgi:hypothetical protein
LIPGALSDSAAAVTGCRTMESTLIAGALAGYAVAVAGLAARL